MCLTARAHLFFFFNDTATTEIYTLSLHDALPISLSTGAGNLTLRADSLVSVVGNAGAGNATLRMGKVTDKVETSVGEIGRHTSELQSHLNLVCRLLLEKKKTNIPEYYSRPLITGH